MKKYQEFVFRFDIYDGSESSLEVYDAQVVEYELINQGTTMCVINDGLYLYPQYSGIEPNRVKLQCNEKEMDVSIYHYRFQSLDYIQKTALIVGVAGNDRNVPYIGIPEEISGEQEFNRLLVISKVKATVETSNP